MAKKRQSKRANGDGSIFQLPNGKWRAELTLGWTAEGKRLRRSRTTKSRADAAQFLRDMQTESHQPTIQANQTLMEFLDAWLLHVARTQSENTTANYRATVETHVIPYIGRSKLIELQPATVRGLIAELSRQGRGSRTIENSYVVLRTALEMAVREGQIASNPCVAVQKPRHEREAIFPFTHAEALRILEATASDRIHALFVVAFSTGMRSGELFGLEWSDIDFEKSLLRVERQATSVSGRVIVKPPKTAAGRRRIELTPNTISALVDRRRLAMLEGHAGNLLVFPGRRGAYQRRGTFRTRVWVPLLERLEIEHRGFHHTRHTYATLALMNGVPLPTVSEILGHAKPSTTLDIYSHVLPSHQKVATDSISRLFG